MTPSGGSVLWFEDDLRFVSLLRPQLEKAFVVEHHAQFNNAAVSKNRPDAVLVDLSLLDECSGEQVVATLKRQGFKGAILVLSSDESIATKIQLLQWGIHDYLWKTMPLEEILLRLGNSIALGRGRASHEFALQGLMLDTLVQKATLNGEAVSLTRIEFRLLVHLVRRGSSEIAIPEILADVWEREFVDRGSQDTLVWKVNKKLAAWSLRVRRVGDVFTLVSRA